MPWFLVNMILDAIDDGAENIPGGTLEMPGKLIPHLQDNLQNSLVLIVVGDDRNITTVSF